MRAATLGWLGGRPVSNFQSALRLLQYLERDNTSARESDRFVRIGNAWRNVGVEKRIVERAACEDEGTAMMMGADKSNGSKSVPEARTISVWSVAVWAIRITVGTVWGGRIVHVDPGFGLVPAHVSRDLLVGRSPGQPNRALRHSNANLPMACQRLVSGRKALVNVRAIGNSRFNSRTTCEDHRAGAETGCQRYGKKLTLHKKIIQPRNFESMCHFLDSTPPRP